MRIHPGAPAWDSRIRLEESLAPVVLAGAEWWIDASDASAADQTVTNLGTGGTALNAKRGSVDSGLRVVPGSHVYLPGVSGCYLSVPDANALDITGDIDVRVRVALDDWTPAAISYFASKWTSASNQRSWAFAIQTDGTLTLYTSSAGTSTITHNSTVPNGITDGATRWVRATLDADDGAGNHIVRFYTSTDGEAWVQLGSNVVVVGTTSLFNSTTPVEIGSANGGGGVASGKFYRAQVLNGIAGTVALDVDCAAVTSRDATQWVASTGQSVSVVGDGSLRLPGVQGQHLVLADDPGFDVLGDVDIRCKVALDDWTPANGAVLMSRVTIDPNTSWAFRVHTDGTLLYQWYPTGSAASLIAKYSTAAPTVADGAALWVRVTHDVDNGSAQNVLRFWTSPANDGANWTQLGSDVVTAGTTSYPAINAPIKLGERGTDLLNLAGKFYRAIVKNGIDGTTVLDVDCAQAPAVLSGTGPAFTAATGQAVVVNRWEPVVTVNNTSVDTNDPKHLAYTGTPYVYLPGAVSNWLTINDFPGAGITGDIDARVCVALDDWTPAAANALISQQGGGGDRAWWLSVQPAGTLRFEWSADATNVNTRTSTASVPFTDGQAGWVRATLDVDNGATGHDVRFYTSTDGATWVQLGATVTTAGTTSIADVTHALQVGTRADGAENAAGKFYRAQVFAGLTGTDKRLDVDTSVITSGSATSFTAVTGQTVTVNRASSGRKATCVVAPVWLLGTDDYLEAPDSDTLDFASGDSFTVIAARRTWHGNTAHVLSKHDGTAAGGGWALQNAAAGADPRARGRLANGSTETYVDGPNQTYGLCNVTAMTFAAGTATSWLNGVAGTGVAGTLTTNALPVRVGRASGSGTFYADAEVFAAAVFRRVLSASEIAAITAYYQARAK